MSKTLSINIEHKKYDNTLKNAVLENVKFLAPKNTFTSILGPSGCGKTTLLRLISGLDTAFDGEISIGSNTVRGLRTDCSVVFQEPRLLPWKNVLQNIQFGLCKNEKDPEQRIRSVLKLLSLTDTEQLFPKSLSGGMAQRVSLARALVNIPDVILLDEPFSSLDSLLRMRLQQEFSTILSSQNITSLMVTHDIEEAIYMSDTIHILSGNPSTIARTYNVNLPKSRNRTSLEFIGLYKEILRYMRDELELI